MFIHRHPFTSKCCASPCGPAPTRIARRWGLLLGVLFLSNSLWAADFSDRDPSLDARSPGSIGTLENGAVTLDGFDAPQTVSLSASLSPCATTFSGPAVFTHVGTYNPLTGAAPAIGQAGVTGCTYTAYSDASWLTVGATGSTVSYTVASTDDAGTRTGHLHIVGAGIGFALTVRQYGNAGGPSQRDYDGDFKADKVVWRPSNGTWYVGPSATPTNLIVQQWGLSGDIPQVGDFDGDGINDFAVWRPSNAVWYILPSSNLNQPITRGFGLPGDIAVPADYDGDGTTDLAVFRPSNGAWYVLNSLTGTVTSTQFGLNGDIPAPGDYDGDGKEDLAVFRPSNSTWYVRFSSDGSAHTVPWGLPGDIPVQDTQADYSSAYLTVWRPSNGTWYYETVNGTGAGSTQLGLSGDVPISVNSNFAVWRPATGVFFGQLTGQLGLSTDLVPGAPHTATQ